MTEAVQEFIIFGFLCLLWMAFNEYKKIQEQKLNLMLMSQIRDSITKGCELILEMEKMKRS